MWASIPGPRAPQTQAVSNLRTEPLAGFDRVRERKNKASRDGKGNPEDFIEFLGLAHVPNQRASGSQAVEFSAPTGKTPLPSPPAPQRTSSLDYSTLPPRHCFTTSHPRAPGRRFAPAQVLFVKGALGAGVPRCALLGGTGCRSALRCLVPGPLAAQPPLAAVRQHPLLLPQRGFPFLSLF